MLTRGAEPPGAPAICGCGPFVRWLLRERDVLRGRPIGRLTQDPEIIASPALRGPVQSTFPGRGGDGLR
ncbi:MAG: Transcriptional regulator, TetR family [Actinoallomurus sp.]|nr:Transcriptional regulator, TetR family [Actinoallomurus sp.]